MNIKQIEAIAEMLATGMSPAEVVDTLNDGAIDALYAAETDDSDEGIAARYGISEDDRFDIHGEPLRPKINDAGESWWM